MDIIETPLPGVIVFEPKIFRDKRGFFLETYREDLMQKAGVNVKFVQDNHSRSSRGVLRGLHYQMTHAQGKLVQITSGTVFDVAVDVRYGSPSFGKWYGTQLDEESMRMMYIPPGFAHGFVVLSEIADFIYKCTDYYNPESEQGIAWDDPDIDVDWGILSINSEIFLSARDQNNVTLKEQSSDKLPDYDCIK